MDCLADFNIYCSNVDLLFICRLVTGHMMIYCCHRFWGKGSTVIYSLLGFTVHMWIYYSHGLIGHIWIYCSHRLTVHLVFLSSHVDFAVPIDLSLHGFAVHMDLQLTWI